MPPRRPLLGAPVRSDAARARSLSHLAPVHTLLCCVVLRSATARARPSCRHVGWPRAAPSTPGEVRASHASSRGAPVTHHTFRTVHLSLSLSLFLSLCSRARTQAIARALLAAGPPASPPGTAPCASLPPHQLPTPRVFHGMRARRPPSHTAPPSALPVPKGAHARWRRSSSRAGAPPQVRIGPTIERGSEVAEVLSVSFLPSSIAPYLLAPFLLAPPPAAEAAVIRLSLTTT